MKLFTRLVVALMTVAVPTVAALAGTVTVTVGDNWYRGPSGSNTITMYTDDVLVFQYSGNSSHPTASDSSPAFWTTFQMNSANPRMTFPAGKFPVGTYPFHCTAHFGQTGTLVVTLRPAATEDARPTATLNLYPNPSKGQITVQLSQKSGQDCKLRLSNVIGQEVRSFALKPELTEAGLPIDLRDLPAGMYIYSLVVDGKVVASKRLILQN